MKKTLTTLTLVLVLSGCATTGGGTTTSTAQKVQSALETAANLIQQGNTGIQTVAPTADSILTQAKAQGDVNLVNEIQQDSAVFAPLLSSLLNGIAAAIPVSSTPSAQIAAVNSATSPTTISAIVAPVAAATSSN